MSAPLRSILAEFGIKFDHGEVHKAEHGVTGLIETLKRVGSIAAEAFIGREIYEFGAHIVEAGVALEHLSVKTGVATDELQGLEYAAKLSSVGAEELDTALGKLGKTLAAAKGAKIAGIDTKDLNGTRSAADFLPDVADKFLKLTNTSDRAALAIKLFGRAGVQLVPLLAKGSAGIRELTEEAKDLGGGLSKEAIEGAVKLEEGSKRLDFALTGLKGTIAESIFPALADLATGAAHLVKDFRDLTKGTHLIEAATTGFAVKGIVKLVTHLGGLTGALRLLGGVFLRTFLPIIALDDAFTFLKGGNSLIGEFLDKNFGPGTQEKVRAWVENVGATVKGFFDELKTEPARFLDDMETLFAGLQNGTFWKFIFGENALTDWAQFWTDLIVAPGDFAHRISGALKRLLTGAGPDEAPPDVPDTATDKRIKDTLNAIPGASAVRNRLGPGAEIDADYRKSQGLPVRQYEGSPTVGAPTASPFLEGHPFLKSLRDSFGPGKKIAEDFAARATPPQLVDRTLSAPVSQHVNNNDYQVTVKNEPKITVTVPPGTPQSEARGVGRAAAKGAVIDLDAVRAALVPTSG